MNCTYKGNMKTKTLYTTPLVLIACMFLLTVACAKKSQNGETPASPIGPIKSNADGGGAADGGGGNTVLSTPKEVKQYIQRFMIGDIVQVLKTLKLGLKSDSLISINDPLVKAVATRILSVKNLDNVSLGFDELNGNTNIDSSYGVYPIKFTVLEDAPCLDKYGKEKDAAFLGTDPKTQQLEICLSAKLLAAHPKQNLSGNRFDEKLMNVDITALFFHELAHAVGYEKEDEAVYVQNYILKKMFSGCLIYVLFGTPDDPNTSGSQAWINLQTDTLTSSQNYEAQYRLAIRYEQWVNPNTDKDVDSSGNPKINRGSNNVVMSQSFNIASEFNLNMKLSGPGNLSFLLLEPNGTYTKQEIEWSSVSSDEDPLYYVHWVDAKKTKITLNGTAHPLFKLGLGSSCFNR